MTESLAYRPPVHHHANPNIHRFCGSHTEPILPGHWYDDVIALGNFELDSPFNVRQLDLFWHTARPVAWGAASSLTLPIAVQKTSCDAQLIELMTRRKRILPQPLGRESPHVPTLREVTHEEAENADSVSVYLPPNGFLTAWPVWCPNSVVSEYAKYHRLRDLLDYASLTIEMGYLDEKSAAEMLNARLFIPGACDVGIFPKDWLMPVLTAFERIAREFLHRHRERIRNYDDYQIRAIGFLTERLGSYILLRSLLEKQGVTEYLANADDAGATLINSVPRDVFGHLTVLTESGVGYSPGLANDVSGDPPT